MKTARPSLLLATLIALGSVAVARPLETRRIAPVTPIAYTTAVEDARTLAARHDAASVMRISGDSMLPYFGDGSVVVVRPLAVERIREGMIVVYTNRDGEQVAHRVVGHSADGAWIARGYNNDRNDSTAVTADNLLGVVYATFHSNGDLTSDELLAGVEAGLPVALAAPAK